MTTQNAKTQNANVNTATALNTTTTQATTTTKDTAMTTNTPNAIQADQPTIEALQAQLAQMQLEANAKNAGLSVEQYKARMEEEDAANSKAHTAYLAAKSQIRLLALSGNAALEETLTLLIGFSKYALTDLADSLLGDKATRNTGEKLSIYAKHLTMFEKMPDVKSRVKALNAIASLDALGITGTLSYTKK